MQTMFTNCTTPCICVYQVCFSLADDLHKMKGKGGKLFAKRQAKSETWGSGADEETDQVVSDPEAAASVQQKLTAQHRPGPPDKAETSSQGRG
jgi:hypothetical protein